MSSQKNNDINIIIEGIPNSGKTMIASLIAKALREVGITKIEFTNPEEALDVIEKRHQYIPEALRGRLAETKFTISETHRHTPFYPEGGPVDESSHTLQVTGAVAHGRELLAESEEHMKAWAPVRQLMNDHPPIDKQ